jgi:Lon protease-like protein
MKAGNVSYNDVLDLPDEVPVFPLTGVLLLPSGNMPLNLFEPRYLAMFEDALAGDRLVGMIQPRIDAKESAEGEPALCNVGCLGRVTAFQETGDGRIVLNLSGVARFRVLEELPARNGYRIAKIASFADDLDDSEEAEKAVDRDGLLETFKAYLQANDMEADWDGVREASTRSLVNSLSMMSPYGPAEKQALLEAPDLKTRAETLVAITEMTLARNSGDGAQGTLQ